MITWENTQVRLGDLQPWDKNPRRITKSQARRLEDSFSRFGQVETIAISPTNEVYDGHQRLSVLLSLHGSDHTIEARRASRHLTEEERKQLVVYLHQGAAGEWDLEKPKSILTSEVYQPGDLTATSSTKSPKPLRQQTSST